MKTVAIHQPQYLPYLGYFHKIANCDIFIHLDNVQFQKGGLQNRNKIKNDKGWNWITVPIMHKKEQLINEVEIIQTINWTTKHWHALQTNYYNAPFFKKYADIFCGVYNNKWEKLVDVDINLTSKICEILDIKPNFLIASKLNVEGTNTERLVNICKAVGADIYLSGPGGRLYLDLNLFEKENIEVCWQEFSPPVYKQQFPKVDFIANLSMVDALFNCGNDTKRFVY